MPTAQPLTGEGVRATIRSQHKRNTPEIPEFNLPVHFYSGRLTAPHITKSKALITSELPVASLFPEQRASTGPPGPAAAAAAATAQRTRISFIFRILSPSPMSTHVTSHANHPVTLRTVHQPQRVEQIHLGCSFVWKRGIDRGDPRVDRTRQTNFSREKGDRSNQSHCQCSGALLSDVHKVTRTSLFGLERRKNQPAKSLGWTIAFLQIQTETKSSRTGVGPTYTS